MSVQQATQTIDFKFVELIGIRSNSPFLTSRITFTDGQGAGKIEKVGQKEITLGENPTVLALTSSADFKDAAGDNITFGKLKILGFVTPPTNADPVIIGDDGNADEFKSAYEDQLKLPPNSADVRMSGSANGYAVTAGAEITISGTEGDKIKVFVAGEGPAV